MDAEVQKINKPVERTEKDIKNELKDLKCPKLDLEGEIKLIYGPEKISLNSGKEFDKYIAQSMNNRGREIAEAINTGTEQIMRDLGLGQSTKNEAVAQDRHRREVDISIHQQRKKTSLDLDEEEKLLRAPRDEVKLIKRQDIASKSENDGSVVDSKKKSKTKTKDRQNEELNTEEDQELVDSELQSFNPHFEDDEDS